MYLQAPGERLGVADDGALIGILEVIHLIGSHQHAELRAEVVVRDTARERAALNGLPQAPLEVLALIIHADDAALRAEEGLVRRAGDDLRALLEGVLEVIADKAQHMGHIVHDRRGDVLRIDKGADLCDRLAVQDHALAEDDELGAILVDELLRALDVDLVDVVAAYREVHDGLT